MDSEVQMGRKAVIMTEKCITLILNQYWHQKHKTTNIQAVKDNWEKQTMIN
jgi:hypothetical protein